MSYAQETSVASEHKHLHLEQYSRNKSLEIKGIPASNCGNVAEIPEKIGISIKEPIAKNNMEVCHREPTGKAMESNIVVQFVSRAKREVFAKARQVRLSIAGIALTPA